MLKYKFVARSPTDSKVKGIVYAMSVDELKTILLKRNLELQNYKVCNSIKYLLFVKNFSKKQILQFTEELYMGLKSGLTIQSSLRLCVNVTKNKSFVKIILDIEQNIVQGKKISQSFQKYNLIFGDYYIAMLKLGEQSGDFISVLDHLAQYIENNITNRQKLLTALFYPIILFFLIIVVFMITIFVIIPSYQSIFMDLKIEIPVFTKIIFSIAAFFRKRGYIILVIILLSLFAYFAISKTKKGKKVNASLKFKLPIIGKYLKLQTCKKFCYCLQIMLSQGNTVVNSLELIIDVINDVYLREKIINAYYDVKKGVVLSDALSSIDFFPELFIQSIAVAEKTNNLSSTLIKMGNIYTKESSSKLQKMQALIEPISIIIMSIAVIIIIVAVFMPLFSLLDNIGSL